MGAVIASQYIKEMPQQQTLRSYEELKPLIRTSLQLWRNYWRPLFQPHSLVLASSDLYAWFKLGIV